MGRLQGLALIAFLCALIGCSSKNDSSSKIRLDFRNFKPSPIVNNSVVPTAITELNCVYISVTAPPETSGTCTLSDARVFSYSKIYGPFTLDGEISISLPSGPAREFRVVGLKTLGECGIPENYAGKNSSTSDIYGLGEIIVDLSPGQNDFEIQLAFASTNTLTSCNGPISFSAGGAIWDQVAWDSAVWGN